MGYPKIKEREIKKKGGHENVKVQSGQQSRKRDLLELL